MKPTDWNKLSNKQKKEIAIGLFDSYRGVYIISQALAKAIEVMKGVKEPYKEESNIQDMEILHEVLFPLYQPEVEKKAMEIREKLSKGVSK